MINLNDSTAIDPHKPFTVLLGGFRPNLAISLPHPFSASAALGSNKKRNKSSFGDIVCKGGFTDGHGPRVTNRGGQGKIESREITLSSCVQCESCVSEDGPTVPPLDCSLPDEVTLS